MKRSRFIVEQIIAMLMQQGAGMAMAMICSSVNLVRFLVRPLSRARL
jgi:hypothetical protein